ncbi:MAG: hypothetical protein ACJ72E_06425, partial [Marmoricola sp.]
MPSRLPGPSRLLIALPLAALLPLSGCGRSGSPEAAPTTPSTPAGAATTPVPSGGTTPSAPVTTAGATSTAGTPCGARTLADGSWGGPVRMDVKGQGGKTAFTSSRGAGTLRLDVAGGKVTGGRWSVTWNSSGHAET